MISEYTATTLHTVKSTIEQHSCTHEEHDHKPFRPWFGEILARIAEINFHESDPVSQYHDLIDLAAIIVMRAESVARVREQHYQESNALQPFICPVCGLGFGIFELFETHREQFKVR